MSHLHGKPSLRRGIGIALLGAAFSVAIGIWGIWTGASVFSRRSIQKPIDISVPPYVAQPQLPESVIVHTFEVSNLWEAPLELSSVSASCRCSTASVDKRSLAAGERCSLKVTMALFDFETQQEARVDLHGELPDRHVTMHFVVRGTAAFPLSFADHDHYSDFGTFKAGENKVGHQLQTVSRGSLPLQWDKITCRSDDPGLTIKFNPLDGNHWQLDMSYGPKDFLGDVTSYVVFTFWNNGRRLDYEQRYPIKATVVGPYYVAPQSVLFGAMRQGEQASQTIYVRSRDNKPVSIDKVIIQNDQSVRAVIVGRDHLVATYFADKVPGEHRGEMIVAIAGEPPYSVRIPYLASVIP